MLLTAYAASCWPRSAASFWVWHSHEQGERRAGAVRARPDKHQPVRRPALLFRSEPELLQDAQIIVLVPLLLPVLSARLEMIGDGSTAGREYALEGYAGLE